LNVEENADVKGSPVPPSELMDALLTVQARFDARELSQLAACQVALTCVISFLLRDKAASKKGAVRLLSTLQHALHDRINGAKPALLFATPAQKNGAPSHQSDAVRRAQFIFALEVLCKSGLPKKIAAHWLADEMRKRSICDTKGRTITKTVLLRWHSERNAKSLSGSDDAFRLLSRKLREKGWPRTEAEGYRTAASLLDALATVGF